MAKDIRIIPASGLIAFSGSNEQSTITVSDDGKIALQGSGSTIFDVQGSQGQLFSVTDSLVGSLFSVNDISGLPILEVFDTDKVVMGTFGQNTLVVTGSNVGVGTDSPGAKLDVDGEIFASSNTQISAAGLAGKYYVRRPSDGSPSAFFGYNSADNTDFGVYNGSGGGNVKFWSNNGIFQFNNLASSELMRITSAGNVGIGLTTPSSLLTVYKSNSGGIGGEIRLDNNNSAVGNKTAITFDDTNGVGGNTAIRARIIAETEDNPFYGQLQFWTGNSASSTLTQKMVITGNGNVGIGTTSPDGKLQVYVNTNDGLISRVTNDSTGTSAYTEHIVESGTSGREMRMGVSHNYSSTEWNNAWIYAVSRDLALKSNSVVKIYAGGTAEGNVVTTTNQYGIGIKDVPASNERLVVDTPNGTWGLLMSSGSTNYGGLHTNGGVLTLQTDGATAINLSSTNVGIGTTTPTSKLNIVSATNDADALTVQDDARKIKIGRDSVQVTDLSDSGTNLYLNGSGGNVSVPVSYLGVGLPSPNTKLHLYQGGLGADTGVTDMLKIELNRSDHNLTPSGPAIVFKDQDTNNLTNEARIKMMTVNDTDYGDNDEAASNLIFSTTNDGVESDKMIITGRGNIGIGTTSPDYKLDVEGSIGMNDYIYHNGDSNTYFGFAGNDTFIIGTSGATRITVDSNGNTNASGDFTAGGYVQAMTFLYHRSNVRVINKAANGWLNWATVNSAGSENVLNLNHIGSINSSGNATIDGNLTVSGIVTAQEFHTEFVSASIIYQSGSTQFGNSNDDIHQFTGNVGIGTTSPTAKLDISQGAGGTAQNVINSGEVAFRFSTKVEDTTVNTAVFRQGIYHNNTENATIAFYRGGSSVGGFLTFNTNNGTERMRIDGSGNVGIGSTAPTAKLEVGGFSTNTSSIKAGTLEIQSYAINNGWFAENLYYNGAWTLRNTGYATQIYMQDGAIEFRRAATGAAGSTASITSTMMLRNNGNVGIGTTAPKTFLHVAGQGNRVGGNIQMGPSGDGSNKYALLTGAHYNADTEPEGFTLITGLALETQNIVTIGGFIYESNPATEIRFHTHTATTHTTGGTEKMRINDAGNVGIGTTSPGYKLSVNGDIHIPQNEYIYFDNTSHYIRRGASNVELQGYDGLDLRTNGSTRLFIQQAGNVGIGTTSPSYKLQVNGNAAFATNSGGLRIDSYDANTAVIRPTVSNGSVLVTDDSGLPTRGVEFFNGGGIAIKSLDTFDPLSVESNGSSVLLAKSSGNVGIGTTSPITKLSLGDYTGSRLPYINGTGNTFNVAGITVGSSNTQNANIGGGIDFTNNAYSVGAYSPIMSFSSKSSNSAYNNSYAGIWGVLTGQGVDANWVVGDLAFGTGGGAGITERMRITSAGNVGIGTTSPGYKLDVAGTTRVTGELRLGANVNQYSGDFNVWVSNVGQAFTVKQNSGNVGIGTTSPSQKLEVNGNIYAYNGEMRLIQGYGITWNNGDNYIRGTSGYSLQFTTYDGTSAQVEVLRLTGGNPATGGQRAGIGTSTPTHKLQVVGGADVVNIAGSGSTANTSIFSVDGNNGRLFEVSDDLSDSLFSVNTIAGLPVLEVFADNRIVAGAYNQNDFVISGSRVGIGTATPNAKLHVSGSDTDGIRVSGGTNGRRIEITGTELSYYTTSTSGWAMGNIVRKNSDSSVLGHIAGGYGDGNTLTYTYYGGTAYNNAAMYILSSNKNIGIGTTAPDRDVHLKKTVSGGQVRLQVENNSNTANSHGVISIYAGGADSGDPFIHWKTGASGIDWSAGIDNSSSDRFAISKNFGPGTNDYFTINTNGVAIAPMTFEAGGKRVYNNVVQDSGAGVANGVTASLDADGNTTLNIQYQYKFALTTLGTSTYSGAMYIMYYNGSSWVTRGVSRSGTSSNHPEMTTAGNAAIIYDDHLNAYNVHYRVESYYRGNNSTALHSFGGDYHWQRTGADLGYEDGNIGIGTLVPGAALNIVNKAASILVAKNGMSFTAGTLAEVDDHYAFAYNTLRNGSSTGFFITNVETNVPAIQVKNSSDNAENFAIQPYGGNVGIGTKSPGAKLDVSGNIRTSTYYNFNGNPSNPTTTVASVYDQSGVGITLSATNIAFRTGTPTPSETMRITSGGNVGIGTTDPKTKLTVAGDAPNSTLTAGNAVLDVYGTAATSRTDNSSLDLLRLHRNNDATPSKASTFAIGLSFYEDPGNNYPRTRADFKTTGRTTDDSDVATTVMSIVDTGNVGIGVTDPTQKLDVNGSAYFRDTIGVNGEGNGITVDSGYGVNGRVGLMKYGGLEGMLVSGNTTKVRIGRRTDSDYVTTSGTPTILVDIQVNSDGTIQFPQYGAGFLKTNASGVVSVDTNTYLTAEADTLATVTGRGSVTSTAMRVEAAATGLGGHMSVGNSTEVAGNYSAYFFGNTSNDTSYFKGGIAYETITATNGRGDMHFLQNSANSGTGATIADSVMTILNDGKVGIGTTAPTANLTVEGSGSTILDVQGSQGQLFSVTDSLVGSLFSVNDISGLPILEVFDTDKVVAGTFGQNTLVVTGSLVGIGTDTPFSSATSNTGLHIDTGGHSSLQIGDGVNDGGMIQSSDNVQRIIIGANVYDSPVGSWSRFTADSAALIDVYGEGSSAFISFNVDAGTSGFPTERMIIKNNGNVGIGTTSPGDKLVVNGSLRAGNNGYDSDPGGTAFSHTLAANSGTTRVVNFDGNGSNPSVWWTNANTRLGAIDGETEGLAFWTNDTGGTWNRNFYIEPGQTIFTGNVGIGITGPTQKLDVSGYARATSGFVGSTNLKLFGDNTSTEFVQVNTNGTVQMTAYGAGFIKSDASGNLSVDTNTYLTTTGKAADSNLLDGIDSTGFTRKWTFDPGSSGGSRRYIKLFTLDDFDDGLTGILSAAGDYGDADKASYQIQIGTRTSISIDVYQLSHSPVNDDYEFYYKQDGSNNYEIWAKLADYNQPNTFTLLSEFGTVTYNFDSITTTEPSGLTQVTKYSIYHEGNLTNLNQLTNGPGYLTAEADTLATVTGRGATTTSSIAVGGITSQNFTALTQGFSIESGDANVTTYRFDADKFRFYNGNVGEIFSLKENGSLGLGTTSPTSGYKLDVVGSILSQVASGNTSIVASTNNANGAMNAIAGSGLEIATDGTNQNIAFRTGASTRMYIKSDGNVGIGTTSPATKLHVAGTATIDESATIGRASVQSSTTNHENLLRIQGKNNYSDGTTWYGTYGQIIFHADTDMTSSARRFMITNALGNNRFAIVRSVDATTDPVVNSDTNGISSGTADFVIDNTGNIGIGQTVPLAKLQVGGGTSGTANRSTIAILGGGSTGGVLDALNLVNSATATYGNGTAINFNNAGNYTPTGRIIVQQVSSGTITDASMVFQVYQSGLKEALKLNPNQSVTFNESFTFPTGDGSSGQVLQTNGSGTVSWGTVGGSASTIDVTNTTSGTGYRVLFIDDAGTSGETVYVRDGGLEYDPGNSDLKVSGNVISYATSDRRLKDNLKPIERASEKISKIGGYEFDWNNKQTSFTGHDVGVIAQEIEEVLPELVSTNENGYKAVKYEKIVALLIEGMKEQQAEIETLKEEVRKLKG